MPDKFKNRYRIPSARLPNWDYSSNSAYFITICAVNRQHFFGKIKNDEIELSTIGEIANQCWLNIPNHFPYSYLDEFIVMPNHIHGIVLIEKPYYEGTKYKVVDMVPPTPIHNNQRNKKRNPNHPTPVFATRAKIPYHQWLVLLNPPSPNNVMKINCHLGGNPGFMIISLGIMTNLFALEIMSSTMQQTGKTINFILIKLVYFPRECFCSSLFRLEVIT